MRYCSIRNIFTIPVIASILAIVTCACTKNEFKITLTLGNGAGVESYQMVYYAAGSNGGKVMEQTITTLDGKLETTGITRYPTVVYIYSSSGRLMTIAYARRGDDVKINASSEPWSIEGNNVNKEWTEWRTANRNALESFNSIRINDAIKKYIEQNPDNILSTLLLATDYNARSDEQEYRALWKKITSKAKPKELIAALGLNPEDLEAGTDFQVKSLQLTGPHDSTITILPGKAHYTILYFWMNADRRNTDLTNLRRMLARRADSLAAAGAAPERISVAEINMQADTIGWSYRIKTDTVSGKEWIHAWAPGAYANEALRNLAIPYTSYSITLDSKGHQLHRGPSPSL